MLNAQQRDGALLELEGKGGRLAGVGWASCHSVGFVLIRAADLSVKSTQAPRPYRQALIKTIWRGSDRVGAQAQTCRFDAGWGRSTRSTIIWPDSTSTWARAGRGERESLTIQL